MWINHELHTFQTLWQSISHGQKHVKPENSLCKAYIQLSISCMKRPLHKRTHTCIYMRVSEHAVEFNEWITNNVVFAKLPPFPISQELICTYPAVSIYKLLLAIGSLFTPNWRALCLGINSFGHLNTLFLWCEYTICNNEHFDADISIDNK